MPQIIAITLCFFTVILPNIALAYTPLLSATSFDGIEADVNTVALGMIGLFMIVAAVGLIIRGLMGR